MPWGIGCQESVNMVRLIGEERAQPDGARTLIE